MIISKTLYKALLLLTFFFFSFSLSSADYSLENWSRDLVKKYDFSIDNLWQEITRKEFVETLYKWYPDYKSKYGITVDYTDYKSLDNTEVFTDIDLESDFGKKLSYFAYHWVFAPNEKFNPNWKISQKTFFIVMKRLRIMYGIDNCKYHQICEKEADSRTLFVKWTYYKYVSKILDKSLRWYYSLSNQYIEAWYKPYLSPGYSFPIVSQTLNGCYAFSVRNILKYQYWIWIYVSDVEKYIWKKPEEYWNYYSMRDYDRVVHVEKSLKYNIDTLFNSIQAGQPVAISYILEYLWSDGQIHYAPHIVAAYSFDEIGIWVSETVSGKRLRIPYDQVFYRNWYVKRNRMFKFYYNSKNSWTQKEKDLESKYNFLVGES